MLKRVIMRPILMPVSPVSAFGSGDVGVAVEASGDRLETGLAPGVSDTVAAGLVLFAGLKGVAVMDGPAEGAGKAWEEGIAVFAGSTADVPGAGEAAGERVASGVCTGEVVGAGVLTGLEPPPPPPPPELEPDGFFCVVKMPTLLQLLSLSPHLARTFQ